MKRHFSFTLLFLAAISVIYTSCKKDDDSVDDSNIPTVSERERIINEYNTGFLGTAVSDPQWTGSTSTCDAGTISSEALSKTLQRVNYFRKMAGLTYNIKFDPVRNAKCQEAALMMHANGTLSHNPPTSWLCYTADGASAASHSNLSSSSASNAINSYMRDNGSNNYPCGHRRWILYSRGDTMGCGSTSSRQALWVIGGSVTPATMPEYIAWPPRGYVPAPLVYNRWSLGVPGGDFTNATVSMTDGSGASVTLNIVSYNDNGYGDNTIVWEPNGVITTSATDVTYHISVNNVVVGGATKNYTYDVTIIQPS